MAIASRDFRDTSGAGSMVLSHRGSELPHLLPTLSSPSDISTKPNGYELLTLALLRISVVF